jgi:hypothetical protein
MDCLPTGQIGILLKLKRKSSVKGNQQNNIAFAPFSYHPGDCRLFTEHYVQFLDICFFFN